MSSNVNVDACAPVVVAKVISMAPTMATKPLFIESLLRVERASLHLVGLHVYGDARS
jgi:hypothetical protein